MNKDYAHRPFFYRAANALGSVGEQFGIELSFDTEQLLDKARNATKLTDFGDMGFMAGLERLMRSLEEEAELNTIGRLSTNTYLLQLLCNRLQLEEDRKRFPEIAEQKISRPIFITGLPRSGTTFLHALLAEDPATRTPLTWEVMYPSPAPKSESITQEKRITRCAKNLKWLDRLAPKFNSIHTVKAHLPQECIAITTHDFASIQFHTTYNVPSYQAWLEQRDMVAAYQYHKRFLQHLQVRNSAERWLLKAPGHLHDLAALMQVYPDAQIIQTHRDPLKVVASISSHANVIRAAFSDELHPCEIAQDWQRYWQQALSHALDYRKENPDQEIRDVYYSDLVADPIGVIKTLYQQLNLSYTDDFDAAIKRYITKNPQSKHKYTLQEFGFRKKDIKKMFADYYNSYPTLSDV